MPETSVEIQGIPTPQENARKTLGYELALGVLAVAGGLGGYLALPYINEFIRAVEIHLNIAH